MGLDRRAFLTGAAAAAAMTAPPAAAVPPAASLRPLARSGNVVERALPTPEDLVARAGLPGRVGIALTDLQTGTLLETHAPDEALPPASTAKAISALYALEALGADHRFETRVLAAGEIRDGVLKGDLILAGGGDPTLDTDALADLAAAVREAGLREVLGAFRVWGGALPNERTIDDGQPAYVGYNPAISGLNLNFNRVHFGWKRAGSDYDVTMDARSVRHRPEVRIARMQVEDRAGPVYTYRDEDGRDHWSVARGALGDGGARWLPVRRPALYAGEVFQTLAGSNGLRLPAPVEAVALPDGAQVVARHESASLDDILRDMLDYSTNLTAEAVGLSATLAHGAPASSLAASAGAMSRWAAEELGMRSCSFVDHSGLGDASRVTAAELAGAMVAAGRARGFQPLLERYDVRDERGAPMRNTPFEVHAKTGTLHFVSTLTGYLASPGGRMLSFAILTGDLGHRATLTPAQLDRPAGSRAWAGRSRRMQSEFLRRWAALYA
ncbi:MAG: D-alanyl-D-alanine carboxypeptidase/D-alanyl-D-alanine-endopeptidase [Rhodosalinus sp.]